MKSAILALTRRNRLADAVLQRVRPTIHRIRGAGYYWRDFRHYGRAMEWRRGKRNYWKISSELIFQYHKLEKGLCLPPPLRFFGLDPARATIRLMKEWREAGLDVTHPIYRAALDILMAYRARLQVTPPSGVIAAELYPALDRVLQDYDAESAVTTPISPAEIPPQAAQILHALAEGRRSVRAFTGEPVDFRVVERAARIAQLSPSACNRQPWRVHFFEDRARIDALLRLQNGNSGFGQTIPLLAVLTADCSSFFGMIERIEPILDAGLFLSPFLLGLQANGLSSCCLNWCVTPDRDARAHEIGNIPDNHQIMTFLAIGKAVAGVQVPRSHRRPLQDCLIRHDAAT